MVAIEPRTRRINMNDDQLSTFESIDLDNITGGVTGRWLANHPFAAAGFLAHHPNREATFASNHPRAFARIARIQNRWGIG
jgi:hypothetical protein